MPSSPCAPAFVGEKTVFGNLNSLCGFELIDAIKASVEAVGITYRATIFKLLRITNI